MTCNRLESGQEILATLLVNCSDDRIEKLKNSLNHGGDKFGLIHLLFTAIESRVLRERIQEKFSITDGGFYIISEIDQVVYSPFGMVRAWPEGTIPGFHILFNKITRSDSDRISFISNKPIAIDSWTCKTIREIGMGDAPVLLSTAKSDLYSMVIGGGAKLECKLSIWSVYSRLFSNFVWFCESLDFAKALLASKQQSQIRLIFVMGEDLVGTAGPVMVESQIALCSNYIQAAIACIDEGLFAPDPSLIATFASVVSGMVSDLNESKTRQRQLMKQRIADSTFDLERLKIKIQKRINNNREIVPLNTDEVVDSIILTPIEAISPCLTNHSPSPGPIGLDPGSYENEIVLSGI
jgi:hypothetical protein